MSMTVQQKASATKQPPPIIEKRKAPRFKMAIPALLEQEFCQTASVTITNMSVGGFACNSNLFFPIGARCWVTLPNLPKTHHFSKVEARVVRCTGKIVACTFTKTLHPGDIELFTSQFRVAS